MTQGAALLIRDENGDFHPRVYNKFTQWELEMKMGELWQSENELKSRQLLFTEKKAAQKARKKLKRG